MKVIDRAKSHFESLGVQHIEVPEWEDEHGRATIIYWNPITLSEKKKVFSKADASAGVIMSVNNSLVCYLLEKYASNFIKAIEERQGLKVACLEEIAYCNNFIDKIQLEHIIKKLPNDYANYLCRLIDN